MKKQDKVTALIQFYGYTRKEAIAELKDMGEW